MLLPGLFLLSVATDIPSSPSELPEDPELGDLRMEEKDILDDIERLAIPKKPATTYLNLNASYLRKANIVSGVKIPNESYFSTSATLFNSTRMSDRTYLISSLSVSAANFTTNRKFNYTEIQPQVGVYQQIGSASYASAYVAHSFQQGDLVQSESSAKLILGNTLPLSKTLDARTFYELRYSFGDADRSRVQNSFYNSIAWKVAPRTTISIDNQAIFSSYTQASQSDFFAFSALSLRQSLSPSTSLNAFAGYNWLRSSKNYLDAQGYVFGVGITHQQALF